MKTHARSVRMRDPTARRRCLAAPPAAAATRSGRTEAAADAARRSGPMAIAPQADPSARTKVASRPTRRRARSGAYVVQVSAQRTEAEAQSSYRALQQKYPTVLGGREANIRRVDLGDKGGIFYRAQVGPFATSEQATAVLREPEGRRRPVHRASELTDGCLTLAARRRLSRADGHAPSSPGRRRPFARRRRARISARRRPVGLHPVPAQRRHARRRCARLVAALREAVGAQRAGADRPGGRAGAAAARRRTGRAIRRARSTARSTTATARPGSRRRGSARG